MTEEAGTSRAGWYPDPIGRFELRFHNGRDWTADVSTGGQRYVDPAGVGPGRVSSPGENGLATASMVLGIVAVSTAWLPFVVVLGVATAIVALVVGVIAHRRAARTGAGRSRAVAGLVLGACALVASMIGLALTVVALDAYDDYANPAAHEIRITGCELRGSRVVVTGEIENLDEETADFTFTVDLRPTDGGRGGARLRSSVHNVEAGAVETFELQRQVDLDEVECSIGQVRGPLPFGIDIDID